jgi:uncharacterized protein DUF4325
MIAERLEINIAKEFTDTPGPRYRHQGDHSGEQFLAQLLYPRFVTARESKSVLRINLDGAVGYPTSFLEEAFGGLAREFGSDEVLRTLEFTCTDEPYLEEQIRRYIRKAKLTK